MEIVNFIIDKKGLILIVLVIILVIIHSIDSLFEMAMDRYWDWKETRTQNRFNFRCNNCQYKKNIDSYQALGTLQDNAGSTTPPS